MGHDTYAHLGLVPPTRLEDAAAPHELTDEIAYLPGNHGLYEALGAQEYDGKVSGIGLGRWFTKDHLQRALRRLWAQQRALLSTRVISQSNNNTLPMNSPHQGDASM